MPAGLKATVTIDDREFQAALKQYLDIKKNADPKKELKRRAKNIGMRLIRIFASNAPTVQEIKDKVKSLGYRVRIRERIHDKGGAIKKQIRAELSARTRARTFTATGWFPAVIKLGGSPRKRKGVRGPERGSLEEKNSGANLSKTLINDQPGAAEVADKAGNAMQQALDKETEDMNVYIMRKQDEAARRNGL